MRYINVLFLQFDISLFSLIRLTTTADDSEVDENCITHDDISAADIASALVLLKKKHRLSVNCINDIIHLLKSLNVP